MIKIHIQVQAMQHGRKNQGEKQPQCVFATDFT